MPSGGGNTFEVVNRSFGQPATVSTAGLLVTAPLLVLCVAVLVYAEARASFA